MEIFVDFGLFEVLLVLGLAALARKVYSRRILGGLFLLASVVLPAALLLLVRTELTRWLAAGSLATALVNAALIFGWNFPSAGVHGASHEKVKGSRAPSVRSGMSSGG